jgi:multidrug efflux system membrane fusion protein
VDRGNIVHANDPTSLVIITQLQPITVVFTIPADQLPKVLGSAHVGDPLLVEAFDRELKNTLATGSLHAIDNQIDAATGTVRLKAEFPNEDSTLYPNQFVNARMLVGTLRGAVVVPTAAIQRSPDATFVYVVKADDTVDARNVEIEQTEGDDTSLRSGVSPGEVVVIDGVDKLRPGVKVAASPASARGGARGPGNSRSPGDARDPGDTRAPGERTGKSGS